MQLDNGTLLNITNPIQLLRPDTTYRSIVTYTLHDNQATLYQHVQAFAPLPIKADPDMEIITDSCHIEALWRSGRYLNARMQVLGKDVSHIVGFIDQGITTQADGSQTLHILLYHDQNSDPKAFTRTFYLSIPLYPYASQLQSNRDSVHFITNPTEYTVAY